MTSKSNNSGLIMVLNLEISFLSTFVMKKKVSFEDDEFLTSPDLSSSDDAKHEIKLEDLSKLVPNLDVEFMDLDSPEDDQPIIVEDEEEEEVRAEKNDAKKVLLKKIKETKDASTSHPPSPRSIQLQELTNQVLLLQSQNSKLKKEKIKAEAEIAFLLAQPTYPNVSLPIELKELPSKFNDLTREIKELKKHVHELEIELKDKGKKAMSSKDAEEEGTKSETDEANLIGPMVETSKKKKLKKFDFVTEGGDHIHLTTKQIKEQKRNKESVKVDLAKQEVELGRDELVDLLGI
ncbi:hypothetical protein Tco_1019085 [Tanacetum coccineum]|uniref:Uncharacterized protein n=1 Tax=Tanacetum coccineum TaxID=301880 RepID=A0ABQ5FXL4_9ASTR